MTGGTPRGWWGVRTLSWYVGGSQVLGVALPRRIRLGWNRSPVHVHPLCMVLGLVFLYGDAIMVYRVFRNESKRNVKILHAVLHLLALVLSIVGEINTCFNFLIQECQSGFNVTLVLFFSQWLIGLALFLFPWASRWLRSAYLPLHVFFGLGLFGLSIATCLQGITEKMLFSSPETYSKFDPEGVLANILGLLLLLFGAVVAYVVTHEDFRRPPLPEEEELSAHFKTLTEGGTPSSP
uniref:Transmembrane ascorbate-dependent reductase CYB561 n=1 Tax=Denticeps clupeoides TaxID=299321 RepID=A0AAY4BNW0_9TELE